MATFTLTVPDSAVPRIQSAMGTDVKARLIDIIKEHTLSYELAVSRSLNEDALVTEIFGIDIT